MMQTDTTNFLFFFEIWMDLWGTLYFTSAPLLNWGPLKWGRPCACAKKTHSKVKRGKKRKKEAIENTFKKEIHKLRIHVSKHTNMSSSGEITLLILHPHWISFSGVKSSKKYVPLSTFIIPVINCIKKLGGSQSQYVYDALKKVPLASAYDVRGSFGQLVNTNPPNPITQPSVSSNRGGSTNPG